MSAAGCAFVDHNYSKDGNKQMTFGKMSGIPVTGVVGAVIAGASLLGAKKMPAVASFFGAGGATAMGISVYQMMRSHFEKRDAEDGDDADDD